MIIDVSEPGNCKSCGVRIYWRREKSQKLNPYDKPLPCPPCDGQGKTTVRTLLGDVVEPCEKCDGKGRIQISHFATCPNAKAHRNR